MVELIGVGLRGVVKGPKASSVSFFTIRFRTFSQPERIQSELFRLNFPFFPLLSVERYSSKWKWLQNNEGGDFVLSQAFSQTVGEQVKST